MVIIPKLFIYRKKNGPVRSKRHVSIVALFIGMLVWLVMATQAHACTIGVANGSVAQDGRPLMCKVRDLNDEEIQKVVHVSGSPYDYVGVSNQSGEIQICMGLNETGIACGNTLVKLTPGLVLYDS